MSQQSSTAAAAAASQVPQHILDRIAALEKAIQDADKNIAEQKAELADKQSLWKGVQQGQTQGLARGDIEELPTALGNHTVAIELAEASANQMQRQLERLCRQYDVEMASGSESECSSDGGEEASTQDTSVDGSHA